MTNKVTIAFGDGIGPEIMESTLDIISNCGVDITFESIEVGKKIYEQGFDSGITPSAWQKINDNKILLKAPITTPQGGGYKSLNVAMRKKLGLFANVRPISSFSPFVATNFPKLDLAIIRENEEDLYAGIEHRQTLQSYQTLKLVTRQGCENIIKYAFEYAVKNNRKKVSCFSKDNIMKLTDGLFHKVFDEIAKNYPQIIADHYIIDIGTARLAAKPEIFDVIVTMNLYGDIISDVAAEIAGSVGLAGSANIGKEFAMFEAIHGSAPDIAGLNVANPTGLIQAAVMMLNHMGQNKAAAKIRNALFATIEGGIHTADIYQPQHSKEKVGTKQFTKAVIERLGATPNKLPIVDFGDDNIAILQSQNNINIAPNIGDNNKSEIVKTMIGFDLFIDWKSDFSSLIAKLKFLESDIFEVKQIAARGLKMWPLSDQHLIPAYYGGLTMLRFVAKNATGKSANDIINPNINIQLQQILQMLEVIANNEIEFVKFEGLYLFDGKAGYSE